MAGARFRVPQLDDKPVPTSMPCPDCGASLVLKESRHGRFWGCTSYPKCQGMHSAHQRTGAPLGTPADRVTRGARKFAHMLFDQLWKNGQMSRPAAYGWMRTVLFLSREEAHISMLNKDQCDRLIAALKARGLSAPASCTTRSEGVTKVEP